MHAFDTMIPNLWLTSNIVAQQILWHCLQPWKTWLPIKHVSSICKESKVRCCLQHITCAVLLPLGQRRLGTTELPSTTDYVLYIVMKGGVTQKLVCKFSRNLP